MSAPYHPQTDGQTERTQQTWQRYLRAYTGEDKQWVDSLSTLEFAYNSSFHRAIGQPPFHVTRTYRPRIGNEPQEVENRIANQWAADYQKRLDLARKCLAKAQESMRAQIKRTPTPQYVAGQRVWLSTRSWQPQVLEVRWIGPFEIQEVLHNACRLRLPSTLKIHPVVNVAYLKPVSEALTTDPRREVLASPEQLADPEWEIESIVAHKRHGRQLLFRVRWKGYGSEDDTWEPAMHLRNAPEVVQAYLALHPDVSVSFRGRKL